MSTAALVTAAAAPNLIQHERRHLGQALARRRSSRRGRPLIPCHLRPRTATRQRRSNPPAFPSLAYTPLPPRRRVPVLAPPLPPPLAHVPDPRLPVALQPSMPTLLIPAAPLPCTLSCSCPRPQLLRRPVARRPVARRPVARRPVAAPPYPRAIPAPLSSRLRHALPCACAPSHLPDH